MVKYEKSLSDSQSSFTVEGAAESQERTEFIMVSRGVRAGMNDV